jgi:hypothetical protein
LQGRPISRCSGRSFDRFAERSRFVESLIKRIKDLKSLQNVAGLYGLVVPCEDVQFPGAVVGHLTGGEPLRAVLPKVLGEQNDMKQSSEGGEGGTWYVHGIWLAADLRCTYGSMHTMESCVCGFAGMTSSTTLFKRILQRRHSRSNVSTLYVINITLISSHCI